MRARRASSVAARRASLVAGVLAAGCPVRVQAQHAAPPVLDIDPRAAAASVCGTLLVLVWALFVAGLARPLLAEAQRCAHMAWDMLEALGASSARAGTLLLRPALGSDAALSPSTFRRGAAEERASLAASPTAAADASIIATSSSRRYYRGLTNSGVFCFFNSVVQSLGSVALLAHYLDAATAMAERWDVPTPVTDALRGLLVALNTPESSNTPLTPRALLAALRTISQANGIRTLLSAQQQQDAHELVLLLLHALDKELGAVQQTRAAALQAEQAGLRGITARSAVDHGSVRTRLGAAGDYVANPFRGVVAQRTACAQCGYTEAVRHIAFTDISLSVPAGAAACRLEQCFAAWTQLEQVEWTCHRCSLVRTLRDVQDDQRRVRQQGKAHGAAAARAADHARRLTEALQRGLHESEVEEMQLLDGVPLRREPSALSTKQVMLACPPRVLLLHVNRSSYAYGAFGATKNNVRVLFPEFLDVGPYTTGASLSTHATRQLSAGVHGMGGTPRASALVFRLSAVVVHYGAHNYGHYVSFRRRPNARTGRDDAWTRVSDASVQACTLDDVLAQNPFLLLYERAVFDSSVAPPPSGDPPEHARALHGPLAAAVAAAAQPRRHARIVHRWGTNATPSRDTTPALDGPGGEGARKG
ncbi:ubiquitinyl hydrolase 1 [Malassezia sp. CBS 17886]|nr:ubiquitinyl hydrolase 1 [Malassezia sp. CBS 17886]